LTTRSAIDAAVGLLHEGSARSPKEKEEAAEVTR